ncbi:MAG: PKD domain-containing protein [Planctomycetota bacterium]|jgi:hypothetical protein
MNSEACKRGPAVSSLWRLTLLGFVTGLFLAAAARCESYGGGTGEPNDPYLIHDANQLNAIGANSGDWDKHFKLMADIDLSDYTGTQFNIIGTDWDEPFIGVFDGNGHAILNFSYTSMDIIGLFGTVGEPFLGQQGHIKNLGVIDPNVDAGPDGLYVGAVAGKLEHGTLFNCYVQGGSVSGQENIGGLVGANFEGTVANCHATCTVAGTRAAVGGLAGYNGGTIRESYSTGDVSGRFLLGGLVAANSGLIADCYSTGNVLGIVSELGGLVGINSGEQAVIRNCYSTGRVSASLSQYTIGALVGRNLWDAAITACFWDIETSGLSSMCGEQELGGTGCDCPCGKTTAQMQTESTFTSASWDFNTPVWTFSCAGPGYPRLAWEPLNPVAHAGDDQLFGASSLPPLVSLDGSASCDPNGDPLTYQWRQIDGPAVGLSDPNNVAPQFVPPDFGTYVFELVVNDGDTDSVPDTVSIVITNQMPKADAGPDQSMSSLPPLVSLDGSASYDPWADPLTYHWNQIAGPAVVLSDANAAEPNFVPSEFGIYVLQLVVNDGLLDSHPDIVGIVIGNNHAPVADAGSNRYAAQDPVTLDGTGAYDPDGYGIIDYQWQQVAGPPAVITGANTPAPTISGFTQTSAIQECSLALVVSDSELASIPDTVKVIIVPDFSSGTELYESRLRELNPPFEPNRPTIMCFSGGVCDKGAGEDVFGWPLENLWHSNANIISVYSSDPRDDGWDYDKPFARYGDMLIAYLSSAAPDYKQPIQTVGMSTGGQPALEVAIRMNLAYADPRYAVNRVTLLDPGCDYDYPGRITDYLASRVAAEQCWIDHYISDISEFYPGALTVKFPEPPADHGTPYGWYIYYCDNPSYWTAGMYDQGLAAGYYLSVIGPGKNLQLNAENTEFYYVWNGIDPEGYPLPGYLEFYNEISYPGTLPEPVTLAGPNDGAFVDANGALLTCQESENAIGYQLLFGPDPYRMLLLGSDTPSPPNEVITEFPFQQTWWTIKVRDQYGSTIYADPICVNPQNVTPQPIENLTIARTYLSIQEAIDDALPGNEIVLSPGVWQYMESINFNGKKLIVRSTDPNDPDIIAATVIRGDKRRPVVTFCGGEDQSCLLTGFTITDGNEGIYCNLACPTITNCNIVGNGDAGIEWWTSLAYRYPTIVNCTVCRNQGSGMVFPARGNPSIVNCVIAGNLESGVSGRSPKMVNCTVVGNKISGVASVGGTISNCIIRDNSGPAIDGSPSVTYSNIEGGWEGMANIDTDPYFAQSGYWNGDVWVSGDYHLKSQAGRWDAGSQSWVYDGNTSLCIDAGNPGRGLGDEPESPTNVRINMGVHGGTGEASKTPVGWNLLADLTNDGIVDFLDFRYWPENWLRSGIELAGDLNRDGTIDMVDFALLALDWFGQASWYTGG